MAKYDYFLLIPINSARMNKIFKDNRADKERVDAIIDYVVPIIRETWRRTRKIPILQTEHSTQKK